MPAQRSTADIAACRGEPQDHLFLFSGARQLPSNKGCLALASGHRHAWTRTIPIGVDRVRQVELLERRTWDHRARDLLAPSRLVERARSPGCVLYLRSVVRKSMVVSKIFEADWFHLPMGHDQKFPVSYRSRQGLAVHWVADLLLFPGRSSIFGSPFCSQQKVTGLDNTIPIDPSFVL